MTKVTTNAPTRVHYNAKAREDDIFYQVDKSRFRLYKPSIDPAPIQSHGDAPIQAEQEEEEADFSSEFAYESDLRDYLANNLFMIESGLKLYEDEGVTGIEFPVGGRFIDILALDTQNNLVVIELKVSRGYDRVVGQLLRYIAWIKQNLAETSQKVRGIIVAREISEDLLLASSSLSDVKLFEYELSISLKNIRPSYDTIATS